VLAQTIPAGVKQRDLWGGAFAGSSGVMDFEEAGCNAAGLGAPSVIFRGPGLQHQEITQSSNSSCCCCSNHAAKGSGPMDDGVHDPMVQLLLLLQAAALLQCP
jgi:hypothetical protein